MTLKSYLWGMGIGTLLSFVVWIAALMEIDPNSSGVIGLLLFYATAFLFFAGLLISLFTWMRKKVGNEQENVLAHLGVSFRQGIFMALLVILLLILQQYRVLTWWDGALVVAGVLLVELYFLTRR